MTIKCVKGMLDRLELVTNVISSAADETGSRKFDTSREKSRERLSNLTYFIHIFISYVFGNISNIRLI